MTDVALFELDAAEWVPIVNTIGNGGVRTCRDCGRTKFTWEHGSGGAGHPEGIWDLCDDCAALDGVGQRRDPAEADVSKWGIRTTPAERERLAALQAKRRATYLAKVAASDQPEAPRTRSIGPDRDRYAREVEARPSKFAPGGGYREWAARADAWADEVRSSGWDA